ncbi:FadR/GntR family transcriptional regulator [Streptomyces sp. S186]|uniref:FadR/GntR family transcriptional regulator n=1 Tax=Streptomyces sp. S186 TaxID=3434395 RepID=UPI003F673F39
MPLRSTARTSLVELVIEQMERLIADGEWPVGAKIPPEPVLVTQLDVGRNTVREAVRALVHTGMLEPRQGDGTYVRARSGFGAAVQRRLRRAANLETYEVRSCLERDAARHAAERRTDEDLAALREALAVRDRAWADGDADRFVEADLRFHRAVAAAAHNTLLAELYEQFGDALRDAVAAVVGTPLLPDAVRHQFDAHTAIVDAIEARDPEAAERAALAHLAEAAAALRDPADGGDDSGNRGDSGGDDGIAPYAGADGNDGTQEETQR